MVLALEVISSHASALGSAARQTFGTTGGTIGRVPGNSWVLPHPKVSKEHAVITFAGGVFYIEDNRSLNGTFLNSSRDRLPVGQRYALSSGDRLIIEPYEIRVSVERDQPASKGRAESTGDSDPFGGFHDPVKDPFAAPQPAPPVRGASFKPPMPDRQSPFSSMDASDEISSDELDPLEGLKKLMHDDDPPVRKGPPPPSARGLAHGALLDQHFRPPDVVRDERQASSAPIADPHAIPPDYDPLADQLAPEPPAPGLPAPPVPSVSRPQVPDPPIVERSSQPPPPDLDPPPRPQVEPKPAAPLADPLVPPVAAARPTPQPVPSSRRESVAPSSPSSTPAPTPPPPTPAAVAPAHAGDGTLLAEFLVGAGLNPADVTPELARTFGQIIRVVVSGVMDVLHSRRDVKDELRIEMTRIQRAGNNPLKLSASVEEALLKLLVTRIPGYLGPVEAFEDAFTDLRHHQLAMLKGMDAVFNSMLAEFKPERLQKDFDQRASRGLLAKLGSSYWDLFCDKWQEMDRDRDATFRRLFRDQFGRAYEEQLQQLKSGASAGGRAASKPKSPTED